MKKIISLILAAAMLLAIGVTAFATEISSGDMTSLKITVRKYWYDNSEAHHEDVLADIYVEDKLAQTVTLSEKNSWEAVAKIDIDPVPLMERIDFIDNKIKVVERAVAGYKSSVYGPYEIRLDDYDGGCEMAFDISNSRVTKAEIPVTVTVKKTGAAEPGPHTFYYDLAILADSPIVYSNEISTNSENEKQWDYTVSYTGDLKGSGNGFSVTAKGEGTYSGSIIIEAEDSAFWHLRGRINKRAGVTAPRGWTYDETLYGFRTYFDYESGKDAAPTYEMYKIGEQYASGEEWLGTVPAAYVNEYKADRIYNESTVIKIESKNENEQNPNTGASVYGIVAAVIALGAAAVALKVRK